MADFTVFRAKHEAIQNHQFDSQSVADIADGLVTEILANGGDMNDFSWTFKHVLRMCKSTSRWAE